MDNYRIFTDSACDVDPALLEKLEVDYLSLTFKFDNDNVEYQNYEMSTFEFYKRMRDGGVAKTSAVSSGAFYIEFKKALDKHMDVLYLGFSSGISNTYNSARIAAEELEAEYPQRKIIAVDTLCASAGMALLIKYAVDMKRSGAEIEAVVAYVNEMKSKICHWFTVDDLVYLKRGGRISSAAAFFGNVLGIKPVLHMDEDGKLVNMFKVRGRRASAFALADKYGELALDTRSIAYISCADCYSDAELLKEILEQRYGATVELITNVGPVIGAHSGPGTLALFFIGKER